MTTDEILSHMKILRNRWAAHVEYSDYDEDFDRARGVEDGYAYASDQLDELIGQIEKSEK